MGQLTDTAVLIANGTFKNIVTAATMQVIGEVQAEPEPAEDATDEVRRGYEQRQSMANRLLSEVQGELAPSYLARMQWFMAADGSIRATGVVAKGVVDSTKFDNDTVFMDAARVQFSRSARLG